MSKMASLRSRISFAWTTSGWFERFAMVFAAAVILSGAVFLLYLGLTYMPWMVAIYSVAAVTMFGLHRFMGRWIEYTWRKD